MITTKSDDVVGRVKVYEALVKGTDIPTPGVPESFRVLIKEFQALGLDITVLNPDGNFVELKDLEESEKDSYLTTDEMEKSIDNSNEPELPDEELEEDTADYMSEFEDDFDELEESDEDFDESDLSDDEIEMEGESE